MNPLTVFMCVMSNLCRFSSLLSEFIRTKSTFVHGIDSVMKQTMGEEEEETRCADVKGCLNTLGKQNALISKLE